jgi:hypothetical protein
MYSISPNGQNTTIREVGQHLAHFSTKIFFLQIFTFVILIHILNLNQSLKPVHLIICRFSTENHKNTKCLLRTKNVRNLEKCFWKNNFFSIIFLVPVSKFDLFLYKTLWRTKNTFNFTGAQHISKLFWDKFW